MVITVVIAGVLVSMATPMLQTVLEKARVARAIGDIQALQSDIATYEADGKGLPTSLGDIGRQTLLDPWGNPYSYLAFPASGGSQGKGGGPPPAGARKDRFLVPINSSYDLYSIGKDGGTVPPLPAAVSRDDIVRANDGGFIGLAEKY
jgi:general secretion pathway protein G